MILQSDSLDKITPALIKARKEIFGAVKNGKGNWGAYASLEDIIEAVNVPLLDNDIFVSAAQCPEDGLQYLVTQATHASGQWMRSQIKIDMPATSKNPAQEALKAQTYLRRAGMEALFNIPRVDDDGNHGKHGDPVKKEEKPKPTLKPKPVKVEDDIPYPADFISTEERSALIKFWKANKMTNDEMRRLLTDHGINGSYEIPKDKLDTLRAATPEVNNA
jgi:hypothetical protein